MGGVVSPMTRGVVEQENTLLWEEEKQLLVEKLRFFGCWRIEDADNLFRSFLSLGLFKPIQYPTRVSADSEAGSSTSSIAKSETSRLPVRQPCNLKARQFQFVNTTWEEAFRVVLDTDEKRQYSTRERKIWHPATRGYAMTKEEEDCLHIAAEPEQDDLNASNPQNRSLDGYTDDEDSEGEDAAYASDSGEDEFHEDGTLVPGVLRQIKGATGNPQTRRWKAGVFDPTINTPVFFGYSCLSLAGMEASIERNRKAQQLDEERILNKQKAHRHNLLEKMRDDTVKRREARERKVENIKAEFEKMCQQRQLEMETAKKVMAADDFRPMELQWNSDEAAISQAQEAELAEKKKRFAFLNREDMRVLQETADSVRHADMVESSKRPKGARLETLAQEVVEGKVRDLDTTRRCLEVAQKELLTGQEELRGTKSMTKRVKGVKASLTLLEGRVTSFQKELNLLLEQLEEAELLLRRAERIRAQEDLILPLYEPLVKDTDDEAFCAPLFDLLAAVGISTSDTMWEKLTFLTALFDVNNSKFLDKEEICALLQTLSNVLNNLKLIEIHPTLEEIESVVLRAFLQAQLDPRKGMTLYEVKSWLAGVVVRSQKLSDVFGVDWSGGQMSTIMRYKMGAVHQFEVGMISMVDLKYKAVRALIKHKSCLQRENKQIIHDRAVAMGDDDPLKADYTKFIRSSKKSMISYAVPLRHGHLENYSHWREETILKGVTKIQNVYRGKQARLAAEKLTQMQAFQSAQAIALDDARKRVTEEILKQESQSGVGRMRWDAKVRMKQAKLRAMGDNRDRAGVVHAMIDESVKAAQEGVIKRFLEIAKQRGLHVDEDNVGDKQSQSFSSEASFMELADASTQSGIHTQDLRKNMVTQMLKVDLSKLKNIFMGNEPVVNLGNPGTPRKRKEARMPTTEQETGKHFGKTTTGLVTASERTYEVGAPMAGGLGPLSMASSISTSGGGQVVDLESVGVGIEGQRGLHPGTHISLSDIRKEFMMLGLFPAEIYYVGESVEEMNCRVKLADSDPPKDELKQRIHNWDSVMTKLKTDELLAEFPCKRLLVKYVQGFVMRAHSAGGLQALVDDLSLHFQIIRNADRICSILVNLLDSDYEFGVAIKRIQALQAKQDELLVRTAESEIKAGMAEAEEEYKRRLNIAKIQGRSEKEVAEDQKTKNEKEAHKRIQAISDCRAAISKYEGRLQTAEQELQEIQRRKKQASAFEGLKCGTPFVAPVHEGHRYNWAQRYAAAMDAAEKSDEDVQVKYLEVINVCNDFLGTAKHVAITIINEMHIDVGKKTIRPVAHSECHGRGAEGNRGQGGRRYKYEAFNIRLKVCVDDHGLFNGDDDAAAKGTGGGERSGALEYMKQHQPGVSVPLTCTVDYHGFRVCAVAKAPIQNAVFTSAGKLRCLREDLVHGTVDQGKTVRSDNRVLNSKLKDIAEKLNLSKHMVKGTQELNSRAIWSSADLRGFKTGSTFHLLNFWRAFPPEDPRATPHLKPTARGQSVLWRSLRPELVRSNPVPLSPDANLLVTHETPDWCKQADDVLQATKRLVDEVIPRYAEDLTSWNLEGKEIRSGFGLNVTAGMHRRGIGVRHMGLLRDMFWRSMKGTVDISFNSSHLRTRTDLRRQLRSGDQVRIAGSIYSISSKTKSEYSATGLTLDRKVDVMSRNGVPVDKGRVSSDRNCKEMRQLLLAEMVARATKRMLRQYLRTVATQARVTTKNTQVYFTVEFLNIVTGAHEMTDSFWKDDLLQHIRNHFGNTAIDEGEEDNLRLLLQDSTVYIVQRLQEMLGFSISNTCASHFYDQPSGFRFTTVDLSDAPLRTKHNVPMLEFAQASILVLRANKVRANGYVQLVQDDGPELYLTLQERKGSKVAVNHGVGGIAFSGYYTNGIKFERLGPIVNDPLNRAVHLMPAMKCHIDTKNTGKVLAPMLSHERFSVEAWAKCDGGWDTTRSVLMTGRYAILVTRENFWAVNIFTEQGAEVTVLGSAALQGQWTHLVATYDGTLLRMFVNSALVAQVDLQKTVEHQTAERRDEHARVLKNLEEEESKEREQCKAVTEKEAESFFKTQDGKVKLNRAAQKLMEKAQFALQMDKDASMKGAQKLTKAEAKAKARLEFKTEMYMHNVQKLAQAYKQRSDELEDLEAQKRDEVLRRTEAPLRIGATCRSKRSKDGRNFFGGDICHVAVYLSTLTPDSVRAHFFAGTKESTFESDRLYALAGTRFQAALQFAPDDEEIISRYAQSIVQYLQLESAQAQNQNSRRSQRKVEEAVDMFITMESWDGLAEIMRQLPSGAFCRSFRATVDAVPHYYSGSRFLPLKVLAHMPKKFYMDIPGVEDEMTEVAASVYRLVLSDLTLANIFGEVDLSWLPMVKSASTVVAMVIQAESDTDERTIDLEKHHLDCSDVDGEDIKVLVDNRRLAVVLNLSGCMRVTDESMEQAARMLGHLQALNLSTCHLVSDTSLEKVLNRNKGLTVLGLSRCSNVSSWMLARIPSLCSGLVTVDLSHNHNVTDHVVDQFSKKCRHLTSLYLQYCVFITDSGIQSLAVEVNHDTLTALDLSGCTLISDHSIVALGQLCCKLTRLNLKAVHRVTEAGASSVTHNCWDLEYLCLEDMYNLVDSAFVFDFAADGRRSVEAHMLTSITEINLHDCNKLTDESVNHIMKRASQVCTLTLSGCSNLTDKACSYMVEDPLNGRRRGGSLTYLDLGYCLNISDHGMNFIVKSLDRLKCVNLAGCIQLTDTGLLTLVSTCTRIQNLVLAQCKQLTDKSMCHLADFLWIEELDISYCSRLSDDGIEVLAMEFSGLCTLAVTRCSRLTERALDVLVRYCPHLKTLVLGNLPLVPTTAIERAKKVNKGICMVVDT